MPHSGLLYIRQVLQNKLVAAKKDTTKTIQWINLPNKKSKKAKQCLCIILYIYIYVCMYIYVYICIYIIYIYIYFFKRSKLVLVYEENYI